MFHVGEAIAQNMHMAPIPSVFSVQSEVREAFGWSEHDDTDSAELLLRTLEGHALWSPEKREATLEHLQQRLVNAERVVLLGAAVEPSELHRFNDTRAVFVAADGAVGALQSYESLACVVSDFDGAEHLDKAAEAGQTIIAHAHGDNSSQWKRILTKWQEHSQPPSLVLSHQVTKELSGMYNFGGFTDGDRALCFVLSMGVAPEKVELVGFSTMKIGAWSATTTPSLKMQKLEWMKRIVSELGFGDSIRS